MDNADANLCDGGWNGWKPSRHDREILKFEMRRLARALPAHKVIYDMYVRRECVSCPAIAFLHIYIDGSDPGPYRGRKAFKYGIGVRVFGDELEPQAAAAGPCVHEVIHQLVRHVDRMIKEKL